MRVFAHQIRHVAGEGELVLDMFSRIKDAVAVGIVMP